MPDSLPFDPTRKPELDKPGKRISHNGRTMALGDWADEVGLTPLTIWKRLKRGWSTAQALSSNVEKVDG